jgi:hypothetical protein
MGVHGTGLQVPVQPPAGRRRDGTRRLQIQPSGVGMNLGLRTVCSP